MKPKPIPDAIFWITLVWIGGLVLANQISLSLTFLFISIPVFLVLALFSRFWRIFALLILIILSANLHLQLHRLIPSNHIQTIWEQKKEITQPIEGIICSEVTKRNSSYSFTLDLIKINQVETTGKINFYAHQESLQFGDRIQTIAEIRPFAKPTNPNSFDFNEFMTLKKIHGIGFAKNLIEHEPTEVSRWSSLVIQVRSWLRRRIETRFGKFSGFFKAILIGEKENIDALNSTLNQAGLSHILAVSGLHVGILSFVFYLIIKLVLIKRNLARIILIIVLFAYAAICHWSPSVTRSVIMISVYLLAKMLQKRVPTNNFLAVSLLIITVINPNQLFSIGLQLSFIAVFSLLNIVPRVHFLKIKKTDSHSLSSFKKVSETILLIMFSSLILSISLAPITLYYFHQINANGIIANVIAIPLMGIILPLSIVVILLPSSLSIFYLSITKLLYLLFENWSNWIAEFPFHFTYLRFSEEQFALSVLLLIFIALGRSKIRLKLIFSTLFLLVLSVSLIQPKTQQMSVTFFDCDLGDLLLIENPNQEVIVIDTGPPEFSRGHFAYSAAGYFQQKGIDKIDWLIVTHAHNDHYGGLEYILKNLKVKHLMVTDEFQNRSIWHYFEPFISSKTNIFTVMDTLCLPIQNGLIQVLHPDSNYQSQNINNMSIVTLLKYKDLEILFTGDMEEEGEEYLLKKYLDWLDSDILKVGHHGSKTSSTKEFIKHVSPEFAFISTSLKNRFHFPHQITLQKYKFLQDRLIIAGKDGAFRIRTDGKTATFETVKTNKYYSYDKLNF